MSAWADTAVLKEFEETAVAFVNTDLAASFDTGGWFARDAKTMLRVGDVMLPAAPALVPKRLLIAQDAFAFAGAEIADALAVAVMRLKSMFWKYIPSEERKGRASTSAFVMR